MHYQAHNEDKGEHNPHFDSGWVLVTPLVALGSSWNIQPCIPHPPEFALVQHVLVTDLHAKEYRRSIAMAVMV
jgi:hypothetical protein